MSRRPGRILREIRKRIEERDAALAACPNYAAHDQQEQRLGYVEFFDWADKMSEAHECTQCPGCGLWCLWVPRDRGEP